MLAVAAVAAAAMSCSDAGEPQLRLDGSARVPDDEGVATRITRTKIELDGKRTYSVADDFVSFSTYTGELEPMVGRRNQYVQLGLRGDTAYWMAGIAAVVPGPQPSVYYIGRFKQVDGDRLVFADGTVLQRRKGLAVPGRNSRVQARIDADTHRVVELVVR